MNAIKLACVLVGATLALAGCSSGDDEAAPTIDDTTTMTTETETETTTTDTETPPAVPPPVTIRIDVRDGRPVGGIARPKVEKNERVVLVITADQAGDVHLHGYDLEGSVKPGSPARIRFKATISGRFEIELHVHPEVHVGELTVGP